MDMTNIAHYEPVKTSRGNRSLQSSLKS